MGTSFDKELTAVLADLKSLPSKDEIVARHALEIMRLRAENAKLRAALEKIAAWDCFTCSPHARRALTEKE